MFEPECRVGFRVMVEEIGFPVTLRVVVPALLKSLGKRYAVDVNAGKPERTKAGIKNHFRLLALMYRALERRCGVERADAVVQRVMMEGGRVFFRGFKPLGPGKGLRDFVKIYKNFERQNIVFDVVEETDTRFEIHIRRCLVFESFEELGVPELSQWMCDIAFEYFSGYHPRMRYEKDRMIARGDGACREIFTWR